MMILRIFPIPRHGQGRAAAVTWARRSLIPLRRNPTPRGGASGLLRGTEKESAMVDVTIVYWRDIPAQVIVGKGRRGAKVQLPERFEQAIDRAAMKTGAAGTDAYLAEWRKAAPFDVEGDQDEVARSEAARLDAEYDQDRLKALIANDGWA
jgi:hypothetical protein